MQKIVSLVFAACLFLSVSAPVMAGLVGPVRIIDTDTWDVGGERVRLFGIDAPEMAQTCRNARQESWLCGVWATEQARAHYEGHVVACERLGTDRYGRTVARCYDDGADVARDLVRDGLAFAFTRYSSDYVLTEKAAALRAAGLHAGTVQAPAEFRSQRRTPGLDSAMADCRIKGNISSGGERIFHQPGQQFYERTRISAVKGERWFCSGQKAIAAGWRAALR